MKDDHDEKGYESVSRMHLALVAAIFAAVAGVVHGQISNQHDARNWFLLTNPHGVDGDFGAYVAEGGEPCGVLDASGCAAPTADPQPTGPIGPAS